MKRPDNSVKPIERRLDLRHDQLCRATMMPRAYCYGCHVGHHHPKVNHVQGLREGSSVGEEVGLDCA